MKKLFSMLCGLAVFGMMFTSCENNDKPDGPIDQIVEDGFYVIGEATAIQDLQAEDAALALMAKGINEVDKKDRDGLYEKYVALEGGKEFKLVLKEGPIETVYGAELSEKQLDGSNDQVNIAVLKGVMKENTTMKVEKDGLYHIVLDLNKDGKLADKLILVAPVEWGVRGINDDWGCKTMEASAFNKTTMTYTIKYDEVKTGTFKFAYGNGWKIELDSAGLVKAETNLGNAKEGKGLASGGDNIDMAKGKNVVVTLTWKLNGGKVGDSYTSEINGDWIKEDPAKFVVGFSGDAFAGSGANDWSDPTAGTLAAFDKDASNITDANTLDGTYVYTIKALTFNKEKGFKVRFNGAWIGFGDFEMTGDTANLGGKKGDNVTVTATKTYNCTFTVVWKGGKSEKLTVNFAE